MRNKTGKILIILGCCCFLAAAALSLYNLGVSKNAGDSADELISLLEASSSDTEAGTADSGAGDPLLVNENTSDNTSSGADGTAATVPVKVVSVKNYDICGVLHLPSIGIKLAVINDWNDQNLKVSACRYSGSPEDQLVIVAHNYKNHFGKLKKMTIGDTVTFTTADGTVRTYEVVAAESYEPDDYAGIVSGDWDLTLFTCTFDRSKRVVVRCSLSE